MANQQKRRKVGRPRLPKGEAKGKIVPVRFTAEEIKRITAAANGDDITVSEWIRRTAKDNLRGVTRIRVVT